MIDYQKDTITYKLRKSDWVMHEDLQNLLLNNKIKAVNEDDLFIVYIFEK